MELTSPIKKEKKELTRLSFVTLVILCALEWVCFYQFITAYLVIV